MLAMALAQLGPALELAAGTGPSLLLQPIFGFAGLLPLEMYFIPRLQALPGPAEASRAMSTTMRAWKERRPLNSGIS